MLIIIAKPVIASKHHSDDLPPNLSTQKIKSKQIAIKNNRNMFVKNKWACFSKHKCYIYILVYTDALYFKLTEKLSHNPKIC